MRSHRDQLYKLYWANTHVGNVRSPHWDDFPWAIGEFSVVNLSRQLAEVLDWFSNLADIDDDDLPDPPFPPELMDNWVIETPEGERKDISVPIVDKKNQTITWR